MKLIRMGIVLLALLLAAMVMVPEQIVLHYDSLSLSHQQESLMTTGNLSFTISDRNGTTQSGLITTGEAGTFTIADSTGRAKSVTPLDLKNRTMTGAVHQSHE